MMEVIAAEYRQMEEAEVKERLRQRKRELGRHLLILGHHYQRQEVIDFVDFRGDSFGLCQEAAEHKECRFIVFCGVHFMAESADILAADGQVVQHPDPEAGCPLASMAEMAQVIEAWEKAEAICGKDTILPLTYMNSEAALKAFCGRNGGSVCTSSNAPKAFKWALSKRKHVFFFPDENLGKNTARRMGISSDELFTWDPSSQLEPDETGEETLRKSKIMLWKGFCHVHTQFHVDHVQAVRMGSPNARIVVHPECTEEVVALSDANGSTEFICKYVNESPPGSLVYVGTEHNLVTRLARDNPDKRVYELARSQCPNMYRIDLPKLLWTLDHAGAVNVVRVDPRIKEDARVALKRMLTL
jgi:quinolinate synthase